MAVVVERGRGRGRGTHYQILTITVDKILFQSTSCLNLFVKFVRVLTSINPTMAMT